MCNNVVNLARVASLSARLDDAHPEILFLDIGENCLVQGAGEKFICEQRHQGLRGRQDCFY